MKFDVRARVERPGGFSLEVDERCSAAALGIVGPSGSGKSTLLDVLAGVEPAERLGLDGLDCARLPMSARGLGYVTQDALLFPHLTVRDNLLYSPRAAGLDQIPDALGIAHLLDRMPRNLSGGERRRVALARAIVSRPRVLLLDEPFGGLDEPRRRDAMSLLDSVRRRFALPMVLVSHLADEVIGLTDWAWRLEAGRVVARGPSATVLRASETHMDNYFTATVSRPGHVRIGEHELTAGVPDAVQGDVRLACFAHDVLLADRRLEGLSARNIVPATVREVIHSGGSALVELDGLPLRALVTPEAVEALALKPGARIHAILKATAINYLGPA